MLFIRGLLGERKTYVRRLLYDARRRHPSPGPTITDFYMDCELPQDATLIRIWRPNGELLRLLLHSLSLVRPPTPRFYYALDDAPRMVSPGEWIAAHLGRTIRGASLSSLMSWANFMASALLVMGDDDLDEYHLYLRRQMSAFPHSTSISDFIVSPWLD